MIEESRTNIQQYSYNNANQIGTAGNAETIENQYIAPDGTQTAAAFFESTTNQQHYIQLKPVSVTSGVQYVFSFFAKNINRSSDAIAVTSGGGFPYTVVRFFTNDSDNNEVVTGSSTTTKEKYPNGWYRFSCTMTASATQLSYSYLDFRMLNSGVGSADRMAIWGFQTEAGSFPTSYIPTSGSTVTRSADFAKITGTNFTDFYNSSEGTLFAESSFADLTTANQATVQLWYSSTERIGMGYRWGGSGSGTYGFYIRNTADQLYRAPSGVTSNTFVKSSLAYKSNNGASSLNGETAVFDDSINLPTAATEMTIGYGNQSSSYRMKQGHIKQLTYYNKRLTNAQLQSLTRQ